MRSAIYNFEGKENFTQRQSHEVCVQPLSTTCPDDKPEQQGMHRPHQQTLVADVLNPKLKLTVACASTCS